MKPSEARGKLLALIKRITDNKLRQKALKAASTYFRTSSIVEKRINRDRIITFYSEWLSKTNMNNKRGVIKELKKLLIVARK